MLEFDEIFGSGGALERAFAGFRPRAAQRRMAERISTALDAGERLLVEAGTGTGKTFAYLVPALYSGCRILISTGTRTLQDQLFHRDLPLLAGALGRPLRIALLKGRSNYLCRQRLEGVGRQRELLNAAADPLPARIAQWAARTGSGDLAEVPELGESHPLRLALISTRDNCAGSRCAQFQDCHVFAARRAVLQADIVVVNHHLLLADLALKEEGFGDLLPSVDAFILDEAHQLPDLAAEFFGLGASSRQIETLAQDLRHELVAARLPAHHIDRLAALLEWPLRGAIAQLGQREARRAWQDVGQADRACVAQLQQALCDCAAALLAAAADAAAPEVPAQLAARAQRLAATLATIMAPVVPEPDAADADADADTAAAATLAPVTDGARALVSFSRGFALSLLPYDVSERFRALTQQHSGAWIFTSATLAVGMDFGHFAQRLGLADAATLQLASPFDYEHQALLYLPSGLPEPAAGHYTAACVEAALPLIQAGGGGAFLLFTSHRALRQAAQLLRGRLSTLPLLVQGDAPREQLLRRFRASGEAVLLGTASFWEGVDVQGLALRLVVIDKLPFAVPDDPVVRARVEYLQRQGGNPFRDYQLPEAVLALKQGVGRLIRSERDRGVVAICDPRIRSRGYGRMFLASLPPLPVTSQLEVAVQLLRECAQEHGAGTGVDVSADADALTGAAGAGIDVDVDVDVPERCDAGNVGLGA